MKRDLLKYYCDRLERRIERAKQTMYNKGTFNLDNEYGEVFLEILEILEGKR